MGFEFQVPFLFGVTAFEKLASVVIHWIFRRTGRHLFLTDDDEGKPPLLKRMIEDYDGYYFMYVCFYLMLNSFYIWNLFPSNDSVMFCAGLHCALSNDGLYIQMWAMTVSFRFTTCFYLLNMNSTFLLHIFLFGFPS